MSKMVADGKITAILDKRSGVSTKTGNTWMSQEYVMEIGGDYPKKMCFQVFGEEKIEELKGIKIGEEVKVYFNVDAKEFNGRWFNTLTAWRVIRTQVSDDTQRTKARQGDSMNDDDDELPF